MSSARSLLRSVVLLTVIGAAGCAPDGATSPNARARTIAGASATDIDSRASSPVLYLQGITNNSSDQFGAVGKTSYIADDFIVPADAKWTVEQVGITGEFFRGGTLAFSIRADADGKPGDVVPGTDLSLAPSITTSGLCCVSYFVLTLPSAVALPAGKYWLTILTGKPDAGPQINWQGHLDINASAAVGSDDGGVTWTSRNKDYVFGVFGTRVLAQTITFEAITPNPAVVAGSATLGALASSNLTVAYRSLTPNVCTVTGSSVSYDEPGVCTVAADQAGNTSYDAAMRATRSVKVDYQYDGFLGSVKNGGVLNLAKAGRVITLQWRLTNAAGAPITTLTSVTLTATDLNCALGATGDQMTEQGAGASGLQHLGNGYYQYNWKSPGAYARSCKTLQLDLGEGSGARIASFAFTK